MVVRLAASGATVGSGGAFTGEAGDVWSLLVGRYPDNEANQKAPIRQHSDRPTRI